MNVGWVGSEAVPLEPASTKKVSTGSSCCHLKSTILPSVCLENSGQVPRLSHSGVHSSSARTASFREEKYKSELMLCMHRPRSWNSHLHQFKMICCCYCRQSAVTGCKVPWVCPSPCKSCVVENTQDTKGQIAQAGPWPKCFQYLVWTGTVLACACCGTIVTMLCTKNVDAS